MREKVIAVVILLVSFLMPLYARPLMGFSVSADAGLAPLIFLNNDAVGFHLLLPISKNLALESLSSAGFALIAYGVYSTSTYPPEPSVRCSPWFHVAEEIGIGFPLTLYATQSNDIALRIHPISLAVTWAPFYYVVYGAGAGVDLELQNRRTRAIMQPVGVFARVNYRPSDLGYNALFQAGVRFTILW